MGLVLILGLPGGLLPVQAQLSSPVYLDDAPTAAEGFSRAGDLTGLGNLSEAVRVLQRLLNDEGDRVIASSTDPDLFISVRQRVHDFLLAEPELLERYRALESVNAQRYVDDGREYLAESTHLLTPAGFEAALRMAQEHLESARFHAARLTLLQLEEHPDRTGPGSIDAADMLSTVLAYIETTDPGCSVLEELRRTVEMWRQDAGLDPLPNATERPSPFIEQGRSPFETSPKVELEGMVSRAMYDKALTDLQIEAIDDLSAASARMNLPDDARLLYAMPTVAGDRVYVNDGLTISAWDRFTLSLRWRVRVPERSSRRTYYRTGFSTIDDVNTVAIYDRWIVAITGIVLGNAPASERQITVIDDLTGEVMWSTTLEDLGDPNVAEAAISGPPIITEGTIVVSAVKDVSQRRLVSTYMIGLSLATGRPVWSTVVGSAGVLPTTYRRSISEACAADSGIVFRSDQIGVIAALEAATGRVRWVRRVRPEYISRMGRFFPWQISAPLLNDGRLYSLSPDRLEVLQLDMQTGAEVARPTSTSHLDEPEYLLDGGEVILGVADNRITAKRKETFGTSSASYQLLSVEAPGIRGRVVVAGDEAIVPVADGVVIASLTDRQREPELIKLDQSGNFVPLSSQLIVVDDQHIYTYLLWDMAEPMLRQRMDADPRDPSPAITYADLAYRAGKTDRILGAVDWAIRSIERDPLSAANERARAELFQSLLNMVEPPPGSPISATLEHDLRELLITRLGQTAALPIEQVAHLMAAGQFYTSIDQPQRAIQSYQTILESAVLADATFTSGSTTLSAEIEATRRLRRLVQVYGPEVYAAYDAEAERLLGEAARSSDPQQFERIARRYPLSRVAPKAWGDAADRYLRQGRTPLAIFALEEGYRAADNVLPIDDPLVGELAGRLITLMSESGRIVRAAQTLDTLLEERPALVLTHDGVPLDTELLTESLAQRLAGAERRPKIGPVVLGSQPIRTASVVDQTRTEPVDWIVAMPDMGRGNGAPTDRVMMRSGEDELAMWAVDRFGNFEKLWGGFFDAEVPLHMDDQAVYLARAGTVNDPLSRVILRCDIETGEVEWRSPDLATIFPSDPDLELQIKQLTDAHTMQIDTPLDPAVPIHGRWLAFDDTTLIAIEATGRAAAIDLENGATLWSRGRLMQKVHDVALDAGTLVIVGSEEMLFDQQRAVRVDELDARPHAIVALDARSGQTLARHEEPSQARWVKLTPGGVAIVGLDTGILSLDPFGRGVRWRNEAKALQATLGAWVFPGRIIVRDQEDQIWQINTATGVRKAEPLDTQRRLRPGYLRIQFAQHADQLILATSYGFVLYNEEGDVVAADAIEPEVQIHPVQFTDQHLVTLDQVGDPQDNIHAYYDLNIFDAASGKLVGASAEQLPVRVDLQDPPRSMAIVDGWIVVSTIGSSIAVDAPASDRP